MASLSEKLRRERELRGISLKQISDDTNIGVRFLEALEEDRPELIPGEFYRRSYLRAYARSLGLDEERAVNAYAFTHQEKNSEDESPEGRARPGMVPWLPWALGACFLAAIVSVVFFARSSSDSAESSPPGAVTVTDVNNVATAGARSLSPDAPASALPATLENDVPMLTPSRERYEQRERQEQHEQAPADGALRLVVAVGESCWLEIEADGEVVSTGLKEEGFRQEFTADTELKLWLGNAGGVSLWVNDKPLRSLGREGQVRKDLSITPDNFMDFVIVESSSS
ncbi:MAG: helix-turn-helix domain-containing protein [Acidobacteriota bacterium]|nr:MAG: helix-turn-helix domain-containing protein [Acidobacteriota bacterium]